MKVKWSLFLIILLLLVLFIPNYTFANSTQTNTTYHIKSLKNELGNNINYGTLYVYIDGIEYKGFEINYMINYSGFDFFISTSSENLGKEVTFKLKIEDTFIDLASNIQVVINNDCYFSSNIELTALQELPPLIQHIKIQYNDQLFTQDMIFNDTIISGTITTNIGDNLTLKVFAIYPDNSEKDITETCNWSIQLLQTISPGKFKAVNIGSAEYGINVNASNRAVKITLNVVDISPILLQSNIQDNATNITTNDTFTFKFDKLIQQGNNFSSISILNSDGTPLGTNKLISGDTLTIKPIVNLKYDSNYILNIPIGSIQNLGTQSNTEDLLYHFTTVSNTIPLVTTIKIDGEVISNFSSNVKTYDIVLPKGTTIAPKIAVVAGDKQADIEISPITVVPGSITITVKSADGLITDTYVLNITIGENDNCFIATAVYGSLLEPHVNVLRQFRDNVLMKFSAGQWFVKNYYQYSPPLADYIRSNEGLRFAVRMILTPIILGIEYWKLVGLGLLSILGILIWKRKYEFA